MTLPFCFVFQNVNSKDPSQENTAETVVNGAAAVANGDA
jgi:hypothetical protein